MTEAPFVVWKKGFELGIPPVDAEHQRFVQMLNDLHVAMTRRDADRLLRATHVRLANYAASHFLSEEQYLAAVDYPELPSHRNEHAWFMSKLESLLRHDRESARAALSFMSDWLIQHILGTDKAYARWIEGNVAAEAVPYGRVRARPVF